MECGFGVGTHAMNLLTIGSRDPISHEDGVTPFWLNWQTKELWHYVKGEWVKLTRSQ